VRENRYVVTLKSHYNFALLKDYQMTFGISGGSR